MTVKRITYLQELLAFVGLQDRLQLAWISSAEAHKFVDIATQYAEKLKKLGPNPLQKYSLQSCLAAKALVSAPTAIQSDEQRG